MLYSLLVVLEGKGNKFVCSCAGKGNSLVRSSRGSGTISFVFYQGKGRVSSPFPCTTTNCLLLMINILGTQMVSKLIIYQQFYLAIVLMSDILQTFKGCGIDGNIELPTLDPWCNNRPSTKKLSLNLSATKVWILRNFCKSVWLETSLIFKNIDWFPI